MGLFAKAKEPFLRGFLKLENGVRSHGAFGRLFRMLDPEQYRAAFQRFMAGFSERCEGVVAIDGKVLRRSFDRASGKSPLHMVSAWGCEQRLVLAQIATDAKSNEITAAPRPLAMLRLKGTMVTADALNCQRAIARQIVDQGGDYALGCKGNQGRKATATRRHHASNALTDPSPRQSPALSSGPNSMSPRLSEDDLIARYFAPLAGPAGLGLRDDVALFRPAPGEDLVLTTDALVAGVHFFADDPAEAIARKALRVNLSDLAGKGARPVGFLLSLALPRDWRDDWLAAFATALGADASAYRCPLIGGDTVATPGPLTLSITALGAVPSGRMAARAGVKPGDRLYITGTIGDAAIGLMVREGRGPDIPHAEKAFLLGRYLTPEPRTALAAAIATHAHGGMDVSDGFVGDLTKMLAVSGVSARVPIFRLPLSQAARAAIAADPDLFAVAATGGDDYELIVSTAPESASEFEAEAAAASVPVTLIGEAIEGFGPPSFIGPDGGRVAFARGAYSHF